VGGRGFCLERFEPAVRRPLTTHRVGHICAGPGRQQGRVWLCFCDWTPGRRISTMTWMLGFRDFQPW